MTTLRQEHDDAFFNEKVANITFDLIMAMDPDEGVEFAKRLVYDVLQSDIEANRKTLDRHTSEVAKRMINGAAAGVRRGNIPLSVYGEIKKSLEPIAKSEWDESGIKRDRGGRFSTVESRVRTGAGGKPLNRRSERNSGIPSAKELSGKNRDIPGSHKLSASERANYQRQYQQLVDLMSRYTDQGVDDPRMVLEHKQTGARVTMSAAKDGKIGQGWNPSVYNLVGVRGTAGASSAAGLGTFDLVSALGGDGASAARGARSGVDAVQGVGSSDFANQWTNADGDTPGTNDRTYRRIKTGAEAVNLINNATMANPQIAAAAQAGRLLGQYGPQAERVLGPAARKTAYRYRGTERKPDDSLMKIQEAMIQRESMPEKDMSAAQLMAYRATGRDALTPERKQATSAKAAEFYFLGTPNGEVPRRVPDPKLSEIQRKSGKIPPSEGVIIDAQGNIAHQSVGFADDHYLPFNLKNLKSLKGGQYVRTRTSGGLTTEDIYTGLVSGARSVTVVSNSGVFTVDFADDLRGGRRMSDKAASMVGQYGHTLDAIKGGQIEREPLDAKTKADILSSVQQEYEGFGDRQTIQQEYERRIKEYRQLPVLTDRELDKIDASVAESYPNGGREAQQMRIELQEVALEGKQDRHYKLDGEGYAASMRALKEQYPYFIESVRFETRNQRKNHEESTPSGQTPDRARALRLNNSADAGYVKPRYNRPEQAQAGYYDASIEGHGKMPASQTNYQNWEHSPNRRKSSPAEASEKASGEKTPQEKTPTKEKSVRQRRAEMEADDRRVREQRDAAKDMQEVLGAWQGVLAEGKVGDAGLFQALKDDRLYEYASTAKGRETLQTVSSRIRQSASESNSPEVKAEADRLEYALGLFDAAGEGKPWSASSLGQFSKKGYSFQGDAFVIGAPRPVVERAIKNNEESLKRDGYLVDTDDQTMANVAAALGTMSRALLEKGNGATEDVRRVMTDIKAPYGARAKALEIVETGSPEDLKRLADSAATHAQQYEMIRALRKNLSISDPPKKVESSDYRDTSGNKINLVADPAPKKKETPSGKLLSLASKRGISGNDVETLTAAGKMIYEGKIDEAETIIANNLEGADGLWDEAMDIVLEARRRRSDG